MIRHAEASANGWLREHALQRSRKLHAPRAHLFRRFGEAWRLADAGGVIDGLQQILRWKHERHLTVPQSCVGFGASP